MEKRKKYHSIETYDSKAACCFEKTRGKSKTVSGDSYTIKELMARHMKGLMPNVAREPYYDELVDIESVDMSKVRKLDPVDQANILYEVQEKARIAREAIEDYVKEKAEGQRAAEDRVKDEASKKDDKQSAEDDKDASDD